MLILIIPGNTEKCMPLFHCYRLLEFHFTTPFETALTIAVKDYVSPIKDRLIGETTIDLENRLLSRYRATCAIPSCYYM